MHYYQFNIGDYASHAGHLTEMEDLGYRRLLDLYYLTEEPLQNNIKLICRLIRMRDFEGEISQVLNEFFVLDDEIWTHKRADKELALYRSKADTARANGKKGGRPKGSAKPKITQPVIPANPDETGSKAKHKTLTIKQEPSIKAVNGFDYSSWPDMPSDQVLKDYKTMRIGVKSKLTQTIVNRLTKPLTELHAIGYSVDDVLGLCCEKSWKGLKKDWVINSEGGSSSQHQALIR